MNMNSKRRWYVLYTRPKQEFKARDVFNNKEIVTYLPTRWKFRRWSDRKKEIEMPLFPGYIFIWANEYERVNSIESEPIVRCVHFNGSPAIISDHKMNSLRQLIEIYSEGIHVSDRVEVGRHVEIKFGPMKGISGIVFQNEKNGHRFGVNVDFLDRTVSISLPAEWLDAIS